MAEATGPPARRRRGTHEIDHRQHSGDRGTGHDDGHVVGRFRHTWTSVPPRRSNVGSAPANSSECSAGTSQYISRETTILPARSMARLFHMARSTTYLRTCGLPHPCDASKCACSGLSTTRQLDSSEYSVPVQLTELAMSARRYSGRVAERASMCLHDRIIMSDSVLVSRPNPASVGSGAHGSLPRCPRCSTFSPSGA